MSTEEDKKDNLKGEIYEYMDTLSEKIEELTSFVHTEFSTLHEKMHAMEFKLEEMNQGMESMKSQLSDAPDMAGMFNKIESMSEQLAELRDNSATFQEQMLEKMDAMSEAGFEDDEEE